MFNNYYVGDFENSTNGNETYVYGAGFMSIEDSDATIFDNINDAMVYLSKLPSRSVVYFHNFANYDAHILIDWLANNGYTFTTDKQVDKRYTGIITDDRRVYQLKVRFRKHFVEFRDTVLLIQGKLDTIGKNFKCDTAKLVGTINYDDPAKAKAGYKMTDKEKQYLRNDVVLLKEVLEKALTMGGLTNYLTAGSFAFNEMKHSLYQFLHNKSDYDMECFRLSKYYKKDLQDTFRAIFPELPLELDKKLRKAYKGGYCINWSDGEIYNGHGLVLDVNSLYPSQMVDKPYPYGYPKHNGAGFLPDCDCFIIHIETRFKVKDNCLPFIQIKGSRFFLENEYIREVNDEVELYLTSVDYKLFHDMYDVFYEDIIESWSFQSATNLFNKFVLDHYDMKKNAPDKTTRQTAKIILNSSYGKFGTRPERASASNVYLNDKGVVTMDFTTDDKMPSATYIPVACFVTSYGRDKIIRSGCKVIEHLRYIDTDSLHLVDITLDEVDKIFDLDPVELGYFACESEFDQARWVRQKTYVERNIKEDGDWIYKKDKDGNFILDDNGDKIKITKINIKACGLTDEGKAILMEDQDLFLKFTFGLKIEGAKLMAHTVKGGKNLHRVDFQIRG